MSEQPAELTLQEQFQLEKFTRALATEPDVAKLRDMAIQLLKHTFVQKATITFLLRDSLEQAKKTMSI